MGREGEEKRSEGRGEVKGRLEGEGIEESVGDRRREDEE